MSTGTSHQQSTDPNPSHRIVLLFDLDCFYAQCERVRLGLPKDVCLALLQWDNVLAVTYPARKFGIKRGDSWDAVAQKSNNACWAIHLKVLEKTLSAKSDSTLETIDKNNNNNNNNNDATTSSTTNNDTTPSLETPDGASIDDDLEESYNQIYNRSHAEKVQCQKLERNVRKSQSQGKACLERYRIASARIFSVVLQALTDRLGGKDQFSLERASIDEFYLDITHFCYQSLQGRIATTTTSHNTVRVCQEEENGPSTVPTMDSPPIPSPTNPERGEEQGDALLHKSENEDEISLDIALERACVVSQWIRQDVESILGFTMSAGISTNKMMAKLAASYGKPEGQAMLHPNQFSKLMTKTKIQKVRNFGGKLGRQVTKVLETYIKHTPTNQSPETTQFRDGKKNSFTMGDLQQVSLPTLQQCFSTATANFLFEACRGIDHEPVKETAGALVKSITAFKSFPLTSDIVEIEKWLELLSCEIVNRVGTDAARNHRYPKTCALHYIYHNEKLSTVTVVTTREREWRTSRHLKSIRLTFPHEKHSHKVQDLVQQGMTKLRPVIMQSKSTLGGVGLAVNNFETRGQPPDGMASIDTFFSKKGNEVEEETNAVVTLSTTKVRSRKRPNTSIGHYFSQGPRNKVSNRTSIMAAEIPIDTLLCSQSGTSENNPHHSDEHVAWQIYSEEAMSVQQTKSDLELAKKLQATFDREHFVLSASQRFHNDNSNGSNSAPLATTTSKKEKLARSDGNKCRRIDSFFGKS